MLRILLIMSLNFCSAGGLLVSGNTPVPQEASAYGWERGPIPCNHVVCRDCGKEVTSAARLPDGEAIRFFADNEIEMPPLVQHRSDYCRAVKKDQIRLQQLALQPGWGMAALAQIEDRRWMYAGDLVFADGWTPGEDVLQVWRTQSDHENYRYNVRPLLDRFGRR